MSVPKALPVHWNQLVCTRISIVEPISVELFTAQQSGITHGPSPGAPLRLAKLYTHLLRFLQNGSHSMTRHARIIITTGEMAKHIEYSWFQISKQKRLRNEMTHRSQYFFNHCKNSKLSCILQRTSRSTGMGYYNFSISAAIGVVAQFHIAHLVDFVQLERCLQDLKVVDARYACTSNLEVNAGSQSRTGH